MIPKPFLMAAAGLSLCAHAADPVMDTASQRALFDSYQMCASLHLPEDFRQIRDPEQSVNAAIRLCRVERLALAGQFALDNPGTTETDRYLKSRQKRIVATLGSWITASSPAGAPHPLTPPKQPPK